MGSFVVDIIIVLIFALSIFIAYKKGIVSVVYGIASWVIIFILVFVFYKPITNIVVDKTEFDEFISEKIEKNLESSFEDENVLSEENSNISSSFINIINEYVLEAEEKEADNIADYVANEISYDVVSGVVMIVLFVIAKIIMLLLQYVLEFIVSLPLIRSFNKTAGIVYGVVRAFLLIYIILAILSLVSPLLADTNVILFIKSSNIGSIFYNDNIILKFL